MEIVIFGATGKVGRHLVSQALLREMKVRAFGRNVHQLPDKDPKLELVKGGVFDESEVRDVISGCNGVLTAYSGNSDNNDKTLTVGIKNVIAQMKKTGVTRIIALGDHSILNAPEGGLFLEREDFPEEDMHLALENQQAWQYLKTSGLTWTIICAPKIEEGDPTGKYITEADFFPEDARSKIYSGDLALFMLEELEKNRFPNQRVGIGLV
ncbi:NAD(P)-dependent oxidoreductase [Flavihumibacter solisilvae]|uniref:NAD(P)-dependent oxidoreductase n=1 Tax=Flavihumibacter solisilvae TaxID=1349421 RepID=UPI00068C222B|nr:NAD(P)H-binding protein [Flavihumibacter solisilvae]